jgi:hypothetical protein
MWYKIYIQSSFSEICNFFTFWHPKIYIVHLIVYGVINMRRRTMLTMLVVAMLLFTTVAVSSVFCDGELDDGNFREFLWEDGPGGHANPCGGGDHPGPSNPQ